MRLLNRHLSCSILAYCAKLCMLTHNDSCMFTDNDSSMLTDNDSATFLRPPYHSGVGVMFGTVIATRVVERLDKLNLSWLTRRQITGKSAITFQ